MPFQIRERMTVAPCVRHELNKEHRETLENSLKSSKLISDLYLEQLRNGSHKSKSWVKTLPIEEKEANSDDVVIIGELIIISLMTACA